MRLYAFSISKNSLEFYDKVLRGIHIRNMEDREGNKMKDEHLITELDKVFPGFKILYKNTSGFIHFSNEHLFMNNKVKNQNKDSFILKTSVGDIDRLETFEKVDYCFNMFQAGWNLYRLVYSYRYDLENPAADE